MSFTPLCKEKNECPTLDLMDQNRCSCHKIELYQFILYQPDVKSFILNSKHILEKTLDQDKQMVFVKKCQLDISSRSKLQDTSGMG